MDPYPQEYWHFFEPHLSNQAILPVDSTNSTRAGPSATHGPAPLDGVSPNVPFDRWPLAEPGTLSCVNPTDTYEDPFILWNSDQTLVGCLSMPHGSSVRLRPQMRLS